MLKPIITDDEFDKLPMETQLNYLWCRNCGVYYYYTKTKHCPKCNSKP
jgi:uncharacterized OB-fold protein